MNWIDNIFLKGFIINHFFYPSIQSVFIKLLYLFKMAALSAHSTMLLSTGTYVIFIVITSVAERSEVLL
jgi:hypothetical protein